jgi:uncharacterized protein (DUF983 family)
VPERPRTAPVAPPRMLWRGITKRCPQCGRGHLFERYFTMAAECPRCNLRFDRGEQGFWTGAMAVNIVVTQTLFFIAFPLALVLTWPDVQWDWLLGIAIVTMGIFPIVFYPFSKTFWMALSLWWGPLEPQELERIQPQFRGTRSVR